MHKSLLALELGSFADSRSCVLRPTSWVSGPVSWMLQAGWLVLRPTSYVLFRL